MNSIGLVFRKYDRNTLNQMKKQTFNLIREVDKLSTLSETILYNVQPDPNSSKQFHSHILFKSRYISTLKKVSQRILKANLWMNEFIYNMPFFSNVEVLKSCYGEVRIHRVYDEKGFVDYINETKKSKGGSNSYYYFTQNQLELIEDLKF